MDNPTNQRIQVSASYNRAANIVAAIACLEDEKAEELEKINKIEIVRMNCEDIADDVDQLARAIYLKEEKFLKELSEPARKENFKKVEAKENHYLDNIDALPTEEI